MADKDPKPTADPEPSSQGTGPSTAAAAPFDAGAVFQHPAPAKVADPAPFAHAVPEAFDHGGHQAGGGDAAIEAEDVVDDGDSALGETVSTYTTSLASSAVNYPVEHGRRYHAYQHGRYSRPNDEREMDRLLITHSMFTTVSGGLFQAPVNFATPQRVLDVGTGSGVWTIEMADKYPESSFVGNDLSANMPTFVPPNVKFEVDDVESDWVYEEPFTYIFSRYMAVSIGDWPKLVASVFQNLAPRGWAEFQDFDLSFYSEDGTLVPDNPLRVCVETMNEASRKMGRDPCPGSKLEGWLRAAGFAGIVHRRYRIPLGPWAKDPLLKTVGMHNYMQLNHGLEGLLMRLYLQVLKWKEEEVMALCARIRKETLQNPAVHPMLDYHIVYGQKPE